MSATYQSGFLPLGFSILIILIVAMVLKKQKSIRAQLLFFAAVALLGTVSLYCMQWFSLRQGNYRDGPVVSVLIESLKLLSCLLILGQFFVWKGEKRRPIRWGALFLTLLPLWLAGVHSAYLDRLLISPAVVILSLLIAWFDLLLQEDRDARERERELERRQALLFQEMMNPHFVFNSLQVIQQLCRTDPRQGADALEALAGYLRKNLDALSAGALIPFEKELEHIEEYVALEKLVPGSAFQVVYDLEVKDFQVPALSIQPLVENAIHYGARPLGAQGLVFVSTSRQGRVVRVTIEDNGRGFLSTTAQQHQHISHGLESVRGRLAAQCDGSVHITSNETGTRVVVLIPERRKDGHTDRG